MIAIDHARQEQIEHGRLEALTAFPRTWKDIVSTWRCDDSGDAAWLVYTANYLFRCGNVRWALDPMTLPHRLNHSNLPDLAADLQGLDFILLSHKHSDHFNPQIIRDLRYLPARWVVPADLMPMVAVPDGLAQDQLVVPRSLEAIEIEGIRITPFASLHWEASCANDRSHPTDGLRGVPETGYLVEHNSKRWLFPGDIRCFDPNGLPDFGPVDVLFAHVWLGRGAASPPEDSILDKFCQFYLAFRPRRIILAHLRDWGRQAPDFWGIEHASAILTKFQERAPDILVEIALMGDKIVL